MKIMNSVQLIGYVGAAPQVIKFASGHKLAIIRIATHHKKEGADNPITTWHVVRAWNEKAGYAESNFVKGSHILVEGQLAYRTIQKTGPKQSFMNIIAHTIMNLDR
jgi:single-strand DNA-binding protein